MTLTERALGSTPTAHLAEWRGNPPDEHIQHLQKHFYYDSGDARRGTKVGKTYGCMYHVIINGLVPVSYIGCRMLEEL